ncbi:MAG TPA: hypothetical protein VFZ23_09885 [Pyrinomonadaceae bacterium]
MKTPVSFVVGFILSVAVAHCAISSLSAQTPGPPFGPWSSLEPVAVLNTLANELPSGISHDGLRLYFQRAPGDIWVSSRPSIKAEWEVPVKLPDTINTTMYQEGQAFESMDGHWLYFGSNRPGSLGMDIWVSWRQHKHDDMGWEAPVNLSSVNSVGFENAPMLFVDEHTGTTQMYLGAAPYLGGTQAYADIYMSTLGPNGFSMPVAVTELNVPTHNDGKPWVRRDGLEIIFSSYRQSQIGPFNPPGALYTSTRASTENPWSAPVMVINAFPAGQPGDWYVTTPVLSWSATELYVGLNQPGVDPGDIYVIRREKLRGRR